MVVEDGTLRIQQIIADSERQLKLTEVTKDIPLEIDSGNLSVMDINFLDEDALRNSNDRDNLLSSVGRDGIQSLINNLYRLDRVTVDNLPYIALPAPTTVLPREKPVPKAKPLTKWEAYAKKKGIVKRKKEKKVWDEYAQEFVPRYGKLRIQVEKEKNWVMEIPRQSDPFEDQFAKAAAAKKERIAKNEYQRLRNIARASRTGVPGVGVVRTDTRDVNSLKKAMHFSLASTASLGKFQPRLKNEQTVSGFAKHSRKESDKPLVGGVREEIIKGMRIAEHIHKPQVNTDAAVIKKVERNLAMEEEAQLRAAKRTGRRSKLGGHKNKKSGQALASLTEGRLGDKKSRKLYAARKAEAAENTKGKKSKATGKNKSVFNNAARKALRQTKVKKRRR